MPRLFLVLLLMLFASESLASRTINGHETWSGKMVLAGDVIVPSGSSLTIKPGTELRFTKDAALSVQGILSAKGTAEKPIVFRSDSATTPDSWQGISFLQGEGKGSVLQNVRITGAVQSLSIAGSMVHIVSSTLEDGKTGIVLGPEAHATIERVTVRRMSEGAIDASVRAQAKVIACKIEGVTNFGIQVAKQAVVSVRDNRISGAKFGIFVNGDAPPLEGNVLDQCEIGIVLIQSTPNTLVRGNKITGSKTGIGCQQFSSPIIERNIVEGCEKGIECFQSSSPTIRQNLLVKNEKALSCVQMCNPRILRNDFTDNKRAVYLHLSSYAHLEGNNFEGKGLHLELDNMSYDWELRAKKKPKRNRQAQNEVLVQQGRARPEDIQVNIESEGFVNAKNNYWGRETTIEMKAKGSQANISTIKDGFDIPSRTYEGWPGEYRQDRVKFDGWKEKRVPGTGPEAKGTGKTG